MLCLGCTELSTKHGVKYCRVEYYCGKRSNQKAHKYSLKQKKLFSRDRGNVNQDVGIYFHVL